MNNPIDGVSSGSDITGTSDSGPVITTNAYDLLFAANMTSAVTNSPGSGWTNRIITDPDADIAEDKIVSSTGTYRATASVIARIALGDAAGGVPWSPDRHPASQRPGPTLGDGIAARESTSRGRPPPTT